MKVSQNERNISAIQREELLEKAGIRYRYRKLDFAQGVFSRVELLRTQESTDNTQDPFHIVCRDENMSVQAIELSIGDIAQGVNYSTDRLEALNGPMLCRIHILHHCTGIHELSGCPLNQILNIFLRWPRGRYAGAKWMGLPDLL